MRFVSESLPRLISGADGSDPLPQTLVFITYSLGWAVTHLSSGSALCLLNVEYR